MNKFFNNLKKYQKYAIRSAKAELKSEVADSYLNWLWWIIEPFCFMLIYTFVFGYLFKSNEQYFASFIMVGLGAWEFFNRMVSGSVKLIINNRDLVTKVYVPKYILLLAKSYTYLFKYFITLILAFGLMLFQHVPLSFSILLIIFPIIVMYLVSFGIGLILMHLGVTFNDLSNLTNIGLKMVFYVSGVFYNIKKRLSKVNAKVGYLLLRVNPIAFIMNEMRKACISHEAMSWQGLLFWFVIGIILTAIGVHVIHKNENSYAKVI